MQETLEATKKMVDYLAKVNEILENNQNDPSRLIPILQQIQDVYKYLSKDVISYVATALDVPVAHVYGVATFYAHFSLNPKGKHIFRLCDGTACHVKKSHDLLETLYSPGGQVNAGFCCALAKACIGLRLSRTTCAICLRPH